MSTAEPRETLLFTTSDDAEVYTGHHPRDEKPTTVVVYPPRTGPGNYVAADQAIYTEFTLDELRALVAAAEEVMQ